MLYLNLAFIVIGNAFLLAHVLFRIYKGPQVKQSFSNSGGELIYNPASPSCISRIHSESIFGRNNLMFIFSMIGFALLFNQDKYYNLFHLSLPLILLFPLKSTLDEEIIIAFKISPHVSDIIHKVLVVNYSFIYPLLLAIYNENYSLLLSWIPSTLLIYMILTDNQYTTHYEVVFIMMFSVFFYLITI